MTGRERTAVSTTESSRVFHYCVFVFFDGVGHVGLYIGNGRFIHAPHTGLRVMVSSLNDAWYAARYDGARRVAVTIAQRVLPRPHNLAPLARWLAQAKR